MMRVNFDLCCKWCVSLQRLFGLFRRAGSHAFLNVDLSLCWFIPYVMYFNDMQCLYMYDVVYVCVFRNYITLIM